MKKGERKEMKKQELVKNIKSLEREMSQEWPHEEMVELRDVLREISQLDEPEVLPKELPVIPKFIAEWIETHLEQGLDLYPVLKKLEDNSRLWTKGYDWYRENTLDFTIAYLTKEYEVEEEPLYYALVKGHELVDIDGTYWIYDKNNDDVFISGLHPLDDSFLKAMSKNGWSGLGINDSNADFVKVV